ncbi:PAS domain-containing protein [Bosea minatitlanensis]|uniref:PAS domain-containing protein n=1 Tax=Bosea minatitlanensis TaxID=128782 RepID=A0ABW0EZG3_9HYPH|nr:PAS domain-containing protein [Bosea minatitlanensis]MCT4492428.1 PAS domain-containing protein [Bosea minatitlanensis]
MKNASTRLVFDYWDALRGERAAPERGEIEPGALRHALADTFILENEPVGPVFRLAGTRLCALIGRELRARPFTALWPDVEAQGDMRRLVQTVMDETAGAVAGLSGESSTGAPIYLELLLLPLRYRGRTHARILGALSPTLSPDWLGLDTIASMRMISLRMLWPDASARPAAPAPQRAGPPRLVVLPGGRA